MGQLENNLLIEACLKDDYFGVLNAITRGADVNYIVQTADPDKQLSVNDTPLLIAIQKGNVNIIKDLIKNNVKIQPSFSGIEIQALVKKFNTGKLEDKSKLLEILETILEKLCPDNTNQKISPQNLTLIREIILHLDKEGWDRIQGRLLYVGRDVLYQAVASGDLILTETLIKRGADIKKTYSGSTENKPRGTDVSTERSLLTIAAIYGHSEVANFLVNQGLNINHQDSNGETPLHWATWENHPKMVKMLLDRGADPIIAVNRGWTALSYAQHLNLTKIVNYFYSLTDFEKHLVANQMFQDFQIITSAGHTLGLKKNIEVVHPITKKKVIIQSEGRWHLDSISQLNGLLKEYGTSPQIPIEYQEPFTSIQQTFDLAEHYLHSDGQVSIKELLERYHRGEMVCIPSGWVGHAITIVLYKGYLILSNRGEGMRETGTMIYKITDPSLINEDYIKSIRPEGKWLNKEEMNIRINKVIDPKTPFVTLPTKGQKWGNCSFANPKSSIMAMLYLKKLEEIELLLKSNEEKDKIKLSIMSVKSLAEAKTIALDYSKQGYKQFTSYIRDFEIKKMLAAYRSSDTPVYRKDIYKQLLKEYYLLHFGQKKHSKRIEMIQSALSESDKKEFMAELTSQINKIDSNGNTPLFKAIINKDLDRFNGLIELKDLDIHIKPSNTPYIIKACQLNSVPMMKSLFERGSSLSTTAEDGGCLVFVAANSNSVDALKFLLSLETKDQLNQIHPRNKETPLVRAAYYGYSQSVSILLQAGADPSIPWETTGETPLMMTILGIGKDTKTLELLLADKTVSQWINARDKLGKTALHHAISRGNSEAVKLLMQHPDIDVYVKDYAGNSPINEAHIKRLSLLSRTPLFGDTVNTERDKMMLEHISVLISQEAQYKSFAEQANSANVEQLCNLLQKCPPNQTAMMIDVLSSTLAKKKLEPSEVSQLLQTFLASDATKLLGKAIQLKFIKSLLMNNVSEADFKVMSEMDAFTQGMTSKDRFNSLHNMLKGDLPNEFFERVLKLTEENLNESLLLYEIREGHLSMIKNLLDRKIDPNTPNKQGISALELAVSIFGKNYAEMNSNIVISELFQNKADPNTLTSKGDPVLNDVIIRGNKELLEQFLSAGTNPNAKNSNGHSMLRIAVKQGERELVKSLLKFGADPNIPDGVNDNILKTMLQEMKNNIYIKPVLLPLLEKYPVKDWKEFEPFLPNIVDYLFYNAVDRRPLLNILLEQGMDPYVRSTKGESLLCLAIRNKESSTVTHLIQKKVVLEQKELIEAIQTLKQVTTQNYQAAQEIAKTLKTVLISENKWETLSQELQQMFDIPVPLVPPEPSKPSGSEGRPKYRSRYTRRKH